MQEIVYHKNYEVESTYWWFLARNVIIKTLTDKFAGLKKHDTVLDVGCGTGGFASYISNEYDVVCMDTSDIALEYCKKRGLSKLYNCYLSDFPGNQYKIKSIFMLDVIEHIEDDNAVVRDAHNLLDTNGTIIAAVPAYQWMWSKHDEIHMHYRRYNKKNFNKLLTSNGFEIVYSSYYNTFLLLPAILKRLFDKIFGKDSNEPIDEVSNTLNRIFTKIFTFESKFLHKLKSPFGLSIVTIARKK